MCPEVKWSVCNRLNINKIHLLYQSVPVLQHLVILIHLFDNVFKFVIMVVII